MNYSNILKKCVDSLKEESPDLSYVRGMLEVLMEMSDKPLPTYETPKPNYELPRPTAEYIETKEALPAFLNTGRTA